MTSPIKRLLALWPMGLLGPAIAFAQPPPDPVGNATTSVYDVNQLPSVTGRMQQFTLTPRGEIDGLILSDGTEVKTSPRLSTSMAYAIKPGDELTIHGLEAAAIPLVQAAAITDRTSRQTVQDSEANAGPAAPPPPPRRGKGRPPIAPEGQTVEVQGQIRMPLHGPRGEINGVLLTDGMVLRLPPDAALDRASLLQPGKTVFASGTEVVSPIGKVLDARALGASRDQIQQLTPPRGPAERGPDRAPPPPVAGDPRTPPPPPASR